jgi:hypothetical protein
MYGIQAAQTEQDLREEQVLFDVNSHAAAILGASPDLFSLEPNSANNIHTNHIANDEAAKTLARALSRPEYGPATPEQTPGKTNAVGWGTLTPIIDDTTGMPFKNIKGTHAGRIQYQPVFHPDIVSFASQAVGRITISAKDDSSLGADITSLVPNPNDPPNPALTGVMWARHDGSTFVDQSPGSPQVRDPSAVMTLKQIGPQNGLQATVTLAQESGRPQVSLTLDNFYVRFLGVYLQFLDNNTPPNVLKLASIPEYQAGTIISAHDNTGDTTTDMFVSVLGPIFTILGSHLAWFRDPELHRSGLGEHGADPGQRARIGPRQLPGHLAPGAFMTGLINYGVTALMCAAGAAASFSLVMKTVVVPVASALAREFVALLSSAISGNGAYTPAFWRAQGLGLAKFLLSFIAGKAIGLYVQGLVGAIVAATTEAVAEDSVPIAGWVMLGISLAVGAANLIETSCEIALSPWTYINDLVFTHDLTVQLLHDPNDNTFPKEADHFIVTALFDDGTPHVQVLPLASPVATLPPVDFKAVPLGGEVNVSVAFYQAAPGMTEGVLLGKGTTGLIANGTAPLRRSPSRRSSSHHRGDRLPAPPEDRPRQRRESHLGRRRSGTDRQPEQPRLRTAGTLCNFREITVRQGTGSEQGFVGYSWQGESAGSAGAACNGGGQGQFDQLANLNTGPNAQQGYVNGLCGLTNAGVKVAYSLLSHNTSNFYLDTSDPSNLHLRQVTLAPPAFEPPSSSSPRTPSPSWGVLNFMPDSLLLHPAGHIVSISNTNHKLETLQIPTAPMADADAEIHLLAQTKSGRGAVRA